MKRSIRSTAMAAALLALVPGSHAAAGEAVDLAAEAEGLAAAGRHVEALAAIRDALAALWEAAPLALRTALFVSREPGGYGRYEPRIDNVFDEGEELIVYFEPVGFAWQDKGGVHFSDIVVDFAIRSPDGEVLAEEKGFGRFGHTSRERTTEYFGSANLRIPGASAGSYVLGLTFHDKIGDETATVDLPFEIR